MPCYLGFLSPRLALTRNGFGGVVKTLVFLGVSGPLVSSIGVSVLIGVWALFVVRVCSLISRFFYERTGVRGTIFR